MNAVENLPIFGALVLSGVISADSGFGVSILPSLVLYARVAQSLIHLASGLGGGGNATVFGLSGAGGIDVRDGLSRLGCDGRAVAVIELRP